MKNNSLLKGIKVLDFGLYGTGPWACAYLGNLGADVTRIERPGLDPIYYLMPQQKGASPIYIIIQQNKRSIILNLKTKADHETALRLAAKADVIIQNHPPRVMESLGLTYEDIRKANPRIIYVSSSGYGHRGPLANTPSADSFMQAMSGTASLNGVPGSKGELLRHYTHVDQSCAIGICGAVLLALFAREITGEGQKIETSQFELSLSIQATRIAEYFATGLSPKPMGSACPNIVPSQAFKTLDGRYVNVSIPREEFWPRLCQALGLAAIEKDPRFISNADRVKNREQLIPVLEEVFLKEPARWWLILLPRHDVPCGPCNNVDNIFTDPHIAANRMLEVLDTPWGGVMHTRFPVAFSRVDTINIPAVKPDSSREEVLSEIAREKSADNRPNIPQGAQKKAVLPLQGIKVVELSEEIAGPFCSMQLADFGADVTKVEPAGGDWARSLGVRVRGESALFLALNRNKKSLVVDISEARGKRIIRQLAKEADVLIESFRPGQADKLGLGYKQLSRLNPKLIYCSISAFGSTGPYRDRAASDLEIQGISGYLQYLGEPGQPPVRLGTDAAAVAAGQCAFVGVLAALYHRKKTGIGQKVETSMLAALIKYISANLAVCYNPDSWGGAASGPFDHAETGYQTKDKPIIFGLALSQRQEKAWADFCRGVGLGELLEDPFFREHGMRMVGTGRDAQEWKPVIERAFEDKTAEELRGIIEKAGGQAGIMKTYEDIFNEPQVKAVDMVQEIKHPAAGQIRLTGLPYKLKGTPGSIRTPPPTLGQHTDEVLSGLGYSAKQIAALKKANIVT